MQFLLYSIFIGAQSIQTKPRFSRSALLENGKAPVEGPQLPALFRLFREPVFNCKKLDAVIRHHSKLSLCHFNRPLPHQRYTASGAPTRLDTTLSPSP